MATATASRVENPEATLTQSVALDLKATPNSDSVTQTPTVSDSSTTPQPPEKLSSDVGDETKAPEDCTSSDDAAVLLTEAQKKIRRSERFGVPVKLSEGEKRNSRAERFGSEIAPGSEIGAQGSDALKKSDEKKKAARAERFGLVQSTSDDKEAKKKARLGKSAPILVVDSVEEDKRKARAVRFSQDQPASLSNVNGKGQSEADQSSAGT